MLRSDGIEEFTAGEGANFTSVRADYYPHTGQYVVRSVHHNSSSERVQHGNIRCIVLKMTGVGHPPVEWPRNLITGDWWAPEAIAIVP